MQTPIIIPSAPASSVSVPTPTTRVARALAALDAEQHQEEASASEEDVPATLVPDAPSPTRDTVIKTLEARVETLKKSMWTKIALER